jgi:23S rRNA G2445 N2-methylase RlmL
MRRVKTIRSLFGAGRKPRPTSSRPEAGGRGVPHPGFAGWLRDAARRLVMVTSGPGSTPGHHRVLARTIRGIEDVVAAEVAALAARAVRVAHREVTFETSCLTRALELGTPDDVFLVAGESGPIGTRRDELARLRPNVDLDAAARTIAGLRGVAGRSFDVSASSSGSRSYSRFDVEDAAGHRIAAATGWRYASRRDGHPGPTGLSLRIHLTAERTAAGVRIGARPLHRRAYRIASRPAALHPPLARALVLLAEPRPGAVLVDPFCGVGTIAVEAKLGRSDLVVRASDEDEEACTAARRNVRAAGVDIAVSRAPASALGTADCVVSNLPWGRAVRLTGALPDLARVLPTGGMAVLLTEAAEELPLGGLEVVERRTVRVSGRLATITVARR